MRVCVIVVGLKKLKFRVSRLMKFMYEKFNNVENRRKHYEKHIKNRKEYKMTEEEYEQAAEDLAKTPCDYKNIFGYITENDSGMAYIKYDKRTELFTVYYYKKNSDEPLTITAFRRTWRDFNGKMYGDENYPYIDEIPKGK